MRAFRPLVHTMPQGLGQQVEDLARLVVDIAYTPQRAAGYVGQLELDPGLQDGGFLSAEDLAGGSRFCQLMSPGGFMGRTEGTCLPGSALAATGKTGSAYTGMYIRSGRRRGVPTTAEEGAPLG